MTTQLLLTAAAYLAGATPTSYWIGRFAYGVDLRERGSGNLGATNAYRSFGWTAAVPVVVVDTMKGWAPVALFPRLDPDGSAEWALAYGAAAILGHVFSFWVRFRGGKGVATSAGVFLALAPWAVALGLLVWVIAVATTGYVSLGSVLAAVTLPIAVSLMSVEGGPAVLYFTVLLAAFVVWAHRSNVRRLIRGEENRIGRATKG